MLHNQRLQVFSTSDERVVRGSDQTLLFGLYPDGEYIDYFFQINDAEGRVGRIRLDREQLEELIAIMLDATEEVDKS